ncbi:hypothetical protein T484DRAFT_1889123 [Baffinella frigidus]|nr:hypothetical protein T484DRAFT_1889123 [Cryptophyta sp. CCMP2293]
MTARSSADMVALVAGEGGNDREDATASAAAGGDLGPSVGRGRAEMASSPSKRYPVSVAFSPPGGQVDKAQLLLDADRKAARVAQLLEDDRRAMEEESISQEWDIRWSSTRSQAAPENGAGETLSPAPSAGEGMLHPAHRPVKRDSPPSKSPPRQSPPRERPSQQPYHSFQGMAPSAELARAAGQALRGTPPRVPSEMLPDRSTLTPEDVQYARVRDLRERLVAFYRIFAPQKVLDEAQP